MRAAPPARTGTKPREAATNRSRIAVSRGPYTALGRRIVKARPGALRTASSPASFERPYDETGRGGSTAHTGSPFTLGPPAACEETRTTCARGATLRTAATTFAVPPAFASRYSPSFRAEVL